MGTRYKRVTIVGTPNSSVTRASRYLDKLFRNHAIAVLAHEFAHTQPFGKLNEDTAIHCFENAVLKDLNKPLRCEKGLMAEREKCPNLDPYR